MKPRSIGEDATTSHDLGSRFGAIYEAYVDDLWRNLRRLGVPGPELDDAVQETFLVVFRRWDDRLPDRSPRAWLFGIARRIASRYRRGRGRRLRLLAEVAPTLRVARDAEGELTRRQAARLVQAFVDRLDDRKREVFVLAELEGFSRIEISDMLGVSPNTVGSRIRAARQDFERYLRILQACEQGASARVERRALVRQARRARPTAATRQRIRAALVLRLGGPIGPGPAAATVLQPSAMVTSLGAVALGAVSLGIVALGPSAWAGKDTPELRGTPPAGIEPRTAEASERVAESPAVADPGLAAGPGPLAARIDATAQVPDASGRPSHRTAARRRATGAEPERPATASSSAPPVREGVPSPQSPPGLGSIDGSPQGGSSPPDFAEEIRLVAELRRAVKAGQLQPALALARRHMHRFRSGMLAQERQSLQIAVLCGLGRRAEAVALADASPSGAAALATGCPPGAQRSTRTIDAGEEPDHASRSP